MVRIESVAGIWSFRLKFVKNACLNYYSRNLVSFNFRDDNARVFQRVPYKWISIRRLVKPHANCCVDILTARWLRPAFAESYRLRRVSLSKNLWLFMFEMHLISGITDEPPRPPCQAKCKNRALRSLYFGIYYSFGFSRLFFAFFGVFSGDLGFLYSCSIPGLLSLLNYFLSVSQWAPFS